MEGVERGELAFGIREKDVMEVRPGGRASAYSVVQIDLWVRWRKWRRACAALGAGIAGVCDCAGGVGGGECGGRGGGAEWVVAREAAAGVETGRAAALATVMLDDQQVRPCDHRDKCDERNCRDLCGRVVLEHRGDDAEKGVVG